MLDAIKARPGAVFLDGTLGAGGYSEAILEVSAPDGVVVGLDLDGAAVERARKRLERFGDRFHAVHGGFHEAASILGSMGIERINAAVLDLGLSSDQLEDPDRGFTFREEGPLDMRFDDESGIPLSELLRELGEKRLAEILMEFGEERRGRRVARQILRALRGNRLNNTLDLVAAVKRALPSPKQRIHPATRTFQALRIAVNKELEHLDAALQEIPDLLEPGGRFCVISYHSLEDRRVKLSFREQVRESPSRTVITRKPVRPGEEEIRANPRARSARMRVLEAAAIAD
jgi:16S rRNA (cytosine1402-N4)-methyltransferase